ncbi:hypothetical protein EMWEY_00050450 [Eimeria maxima]|uniref:Uncharacterized protein n=1 Tax=Eimeria maxima TaxID=5804 RepID=U6M306_EIMMA|nr:hypothetical protein EMWEY_00050450 [Eimeria maxima]CDJ58411.1 hypothetical protein EMWEY_00050450 [Eimeria maxima]
MGPYVPNTLKLARDHASTVLMLHYGGLFSHTAHISLGCLHEEMAAKQGKRHTELYATNTDEAAIIENANSEELMQRYYIDGELL